MDWLERQEQAQPHLTRLEQDLLRFVNANPEQAALLPQRQLLESAGVSKPLLINFFRKLGYQDYRTFQAGVEQFFSTHIDSFRASQAVHDRVTSLTDVVDQAIAVDTRSIQRLRDTMTEDLLSWFAGKLTAAGTMYVGGAGTGRYPAHYLSQRARRYRVVSVLLSQDGEHAPDELFPVTTGDLLVLFHYARDDRWVFPLLNLARERGAATLLVAAAIHPAYVASADRFVHVPRGEVRFKNSMAAPMTCAQMLLLAAEVVHGDTLRGYLKSLEETRGSWGIHNREGGDDA
ncbi:MAG: MurR/RpiR family transcriptional regulator [Spirochaetaceae bacterium]|nr:MAG: MurR/RpiR family transcriptional regulator [Spirochaetaceae bacterium]